MSVSAGSIALWPVRLLRFAITTLALAGAAFLTGSGLIYVLFGAADWLEGGVWLHFTLGVTWLGRAVAGLVQRTELRGFEVDWVRIFSQHVVIAYPVIIFTTLIIGWLLSFPLSFLIKRSSRRNFRATPDKNGIETQKETENDEPGGH